MTARSRPDAPEQARDEPLLVTSEAFAELAPQWSALHRSVPGATPFTHPVWHAAWLRHFGSALAPVFLSFRQGEELVGVAALEISGDSARTLGDPNVCDYGGPLALPGREHAIASALFEWLREDLTPRAELWGLPADSPVTRALRDAAGDQGWSVQVEPEAACPIADIAGGFDAYLAALSKKDRHELRRKMRNLAALGDLTYERQAPEQSPAAGETLLRLMRASHHGKDEFLTPVMAAFFGDLAASLGALGLARVGIVRLAGEEVAALLVFEDDDTGFLYNSGYDPAFSAHAVGLVSKALALQDAAERGLRRFDFLRGDEEYKRRLGGVPRPLVRLHLTSR